MQHYALQYLLATDANVLIVEKAPKKKKGGNSFFTDGAIRFPYGSVESLEKIVSKINKKENNSSSSV